MHATTSDELRAFKDRFTFDPSKTLYVGVERECFIVNKLGEVVPEASRMLQALTQYDEEKRFGYELSACQLEGHTGPCHINMLAEKLQAGDTILRRALDSLNLDVSYYEVASANMPLDVFPDPTGRYQAITSTMPKNILLAACRVIGTHVHVGMPDHNTALKVYNNVIEHCDELARLGDNSNGRRLEIYREVKKDCLPKRYETWSALHAAAIAEGFDVDLRSCWSLIRISKFGTIEARMFGASASTRQVEHWARTFHDLCSAAMP